jgi:hypothetical protein
VTLRLIAFAGIALALLTAYGVGRDRERERTLRAVENAFGATRPWKATRGELDDAR